MESHLEDGEPSGDGRPESAEQRLIHEVKVVDWIDGGIRRRCS